MKNLFVKITIIACLILLPTLSAQMFAQAPPKPPVTGGSGGHGGSGDAPDGAPLDGGLSILLLMGAAYGGKKIQSIRKKNK